MSERYILAIDQGTSGTKTLIVDEQGKICARATAPLKTSYLHNGFVEQDPEDIIQNVMFSVKNCIQIFTDSGKSSSDISACGISNQRETFLIWDRYGKPLYNAVVWQCKRSIQVCERLRKENLENRIRNKTGLLIDPYFSGTKLIWLYENNGQIRNAIDSGNAYFGTIDTWLLYRLTNGQNYSTDYTNASRTLFFDLSTLSWDKDLLETFGLSNLNTPECHPSAHKFGETNFSGLLQQSIPISAMIGDSHAAAFGEGCYEPGSAKATMGTGCSILMNIGRTPKFSDRGMVTTICWSTENEVHYALEGVIVTCGATIEWLKNELGVLANSQDSEVMATSVIDNNGVYLIPAFSGLGAPHWDMSRRASISGLTFSSNKNHIIRAALESIAYQVKDVIAVMEAETGITLQQLMVDGGISENSFVIKFLADLLNKPVVNIGIADVSGLGAAYLAGLQQKLFKDLEHLKFNPQKKTFSPSGNENVKAWYKEWQKFVAKS